MEEMCYRYTASTVYCACFTKVALQLNFIPKCYVVVLIYLNDNKQTERLTSSITDDDNLILGRVRDLTTIQD